MEAKAPIDFVVLWVDSSDPSWRMACSERQQSGGSSLDEPCRYRNWDLLRFWFRGVERYAPWVRKIHFVVSAQSQIPTWLNVHADKLDIVLHRDFIPGEYLPTFSTRPIELNLHRIAGLADRFVYFNDDMFLVKPTRPADFFHDDLPCDVGLLADIPAFSYNNVLFNARVVICRHFSKAHLVSRKPWNWVNARYDWRFLASLPSWLQSGITGFHTPHLPVAYRKQVFAEVWGAEQPLMHATCGRPFRSLADVNQQVVRWWQLASNAFHATNVDRFGCTISLRGLESEQWVRKCILGSKYSIVCANDNELTDFRALQQPVRHIFEALLPERSEFEY